ncbi:MAG: hypothetical protein WC973_02440 [Candidatus Dojkabacteria bacterium]|jgi:hypothetical protein
MKKKYLLVVSVLVALVILLFISLKLIFKGDGVSMFLRTNPISEEHRVKSEERSLCGQWRIIRVLQNLYIGETEGDASTSEPDQKGHWDPRNERNLIGERVELFFWVYPGNLLRTEEGIETDIVLSKYKVYFETEWVYSRTIKWVGEVDEDFKVISGTWEMISPDRGTIASGEWNGEKL